MKTFYWVTRIGVPLVVVQLGVFLGQPLASAVTFTVTPSSVSNQYGGLVTLQMTGLNTGETVVVEKFLDVNTNGVIDAADWLLQSFQLTDGQASVIGGVTNVNVPGDSNPTNGSITAQLNIQTAGVIQQIVGQYVFRVSSPTNRFASITNLFTVTKSVSAQSITGTVLSSGLKVPNALVLLAPPRTGNGGGPPVDGTVADNSGNYSISAPPGTYTFFVGKSNYVFDISAAPTLTLGAGATVATNLNLLPATCSISGRVVDTNNPSLGLPGLLITANSTNNLIAIGFTDANGNFTLPVTTNRWKVSISTGSPETAGYVGLQNEFKFDTTGGTVTGVTIALPKATALFYGTVSDDQGHPLAGVRVSTYDDNGIYEGDGTTDTNGYYVLTVPGDDGDDAPWDGEGWSVSPDNSSGVATNYVFSQAYTNILQDQAIVLNFQGVLATNHISGYVTDTNNNPVANVGVNASTTNSYNQYTDTGANGYYSFNVANGNWDVWLNCSGGSDSLNKLGYQCTTDQFVNIANNNGTANFTVQPCGSLQILTSSPLPNGQVGVFYSQMIQAAGCNQPFSWSLSPGSPPPPAWLSAQEVNNSTAVIISGTPTAAGTTNFSARLTDSVSNSVDKAFSLTIYPAPAGVLFYDNFEQFPNGTVLTVTNYVPGTWTAPGAYAQTETNEMAGGSAVVSNFLGSQRLFINAPAGQHFEYDAKLYGYKNLSSAVTDQVMNVQWLSWIQTTTSLTATGVSAVDISSTNLDIYCDGSSCTTNLQSNVFLAFMDYGAIYVFTNNVGSLSGPWPIVQIGTWSNYVGQVMTNQLTLNYPANTFSFSLNNTVLTNNMALPSMFTNILSEIDFTCGENFPTSAGNRFALDDVQISTSTSGAVETVVHYLVAFKQLPYAQTNAGPPVLSNSLFGFKSQVVPTGSNSVSTATVQVPGGSIFSLPQDSTGAFTLWQWFPSKAALDSAFPNGDYTMSIVTTQGTYVSTMTLAGDAYPNPLQVLNWPAAQSINPATNFVFNWNSAGGTTNDTIELLVMDAGGNTVFDSGAATVSNHLDGTKTSVTMTGETLTANSSYTGVLIFAKPIGSDTNSVPGALGVTGYGAFTIFNFTTGYADSVGDGIPDWWRAQYFGGGGTNTNSVSCATCDADGTGQNNAFKYIAGLNPTNHSSVFALSIASVTNAPRQFNLLFSPVVAGRIYTPQFCTGLVGATWAPLTGFSGPTTNLALNQVTITDLNATNSQKFYRIYISLATNQTPAPVTFTVTPSTVDNQYAGLITLQVGGLTNGETVLVQKYRDSNADGIVDAGDRLIQQFNLTDGQAGMVVGGVTNVNVPGDTDTIPGQITAQLNFQIVGTVEPMVEHCLFVLSSPTGRFAPLTNQFTVTDAVSAQTFTGAVLSSGVPIPNAVVYVFLPGTAVAVAGTVADNSGNYSIGATPGTYALYAFKSNYVCNLRAPPVLTLGAGAMVITNLNLLPATCTISGSVADTNNPSFGLPGMFMLAVSTNGLGVLGFTVDNGNFTLPVTPSLWSVSVQSYSFVGLGYLGLQNWPTVDTTGGSVSGVTIALPKGTALFYGTVQDAQNHPLAGFDLAGDDCGGACLFQGDAVTDTNGYYVMAVNADLWSAYPGLAVPGYANYIFSQMSQTNVSAGQAVLENFVGILATNQITGYVKNVAGNPLTNVAVNASATVNSNDLSNWVQTDSTGYYSINIGNATWTVGICCSDCDPNLDLTTVGYQCATSQLVPISDNNAVVNFTLQPASYQAWQTIYFGSTNNPKAAAGYDADGTGQNNQFKYVAGLDPTNPASLFMLRIANVTGQPSQKNLIYNPVVTGRTYMVQFTTNLVGTAYTNLTGFSGPQNSGTQATVTDLSATQSNKFYRVNISLP